MKRFSLALFLASLPSIAAAQSAGAVTPDWTIRTFSIIAILVSLTTYIAARLGRLRARNAASIARLPSVAIQVGAEEIIGHWRFGIQTINRADVSIELVSVEASTDFELTCEDAATRRWSRTLEFKDYLLPSGHGDGIEGNVRGPAGSTTIIFELKYKLLEDQPHIVTVALSRRL